MEELKPRNFRLIAVAVDDDGLHRYIYEHDQYSTLRKPKFFSPDRMDEVQEYTQKIFERLQKERDESNAVKNDPQ